MNYALILAGGESKRCSVDGVPKQLCRIDGKPLIYYTIDRFNQCEDVDKIVIVSNKKFIEDVQNLADEFNNPIFSEVVPGGAHFWDSVYKGCCYLVDSLGARTSDVVTLHGASCPLVNSGIISDNIAGATQHGAAIASPPNTLSTWPDDGSGFVSGSVKRKFLRQVQFPCSFRLGLLMDALESFRRHGARRSQAQENKNFCGCSGEEKTPSQGCQPDGENCNICRPELRQLCSSKEEHPFFAFGEKMFLTKGAHENIKVTTQEDLDFVKFFLKTC